MRFFPFLAIKFEITIIISTMNSSNYFFKHDAYVFDAVTRVKVKKRRKLFLTLKELELELAFVGY